MRAEKKSPDARAYASPLAKRQRSGPRLPLSDVEQPARGALWNFWKMSTLMKALRGSGLGTEIVNAVVIEAKERGCYKLVATSRYARPRVHGALCASRIQGSRKRVQDRPLEFRAPPASALLTNHFVEGHTDAWASRLT